MKVVLGEVYRDVRDELKNNVSVYPMPNSVFHNAFSYFFDRFNNSTTRLTIMSELLKKENR